MLFNFSLQKNKFDIPIVWFCCFAGENGVPLPALVKFVKQAFSYEQWETFSLLVEPTLQLLHQQSDMDSLVNVKTLQLMLAMEPFYNGLRKPKKTAHLEESDTAAHTQGTVQTSIAKKLIFVNSGCIP